MAKDEGRCPGFHVGRWCMVESSLALHTTICNLLWLLLHAEQSQTHAPNGIEEMQAANYRVHIGVCKQWMIALQLKQLTRALHCTTQADTELHGACCHTEMPAVDSMAPAMHETASPNTATAALKYTKHRQLWLCNIYTLPMLLQLTPET